MDRILILLTAVATFVAAPTVSAADCESYVPSPECPATSVSTTTVPPTTVPAELATSGSDATRIVSLAGALVLGVGAAATVAARRRKSV